MRFDGKLHMKLLEAKDERLTQAQFSLSHLVVVAIAPIGGSRVTAFMACEPHFLDRNLMERLVARASRPEFSGNKYQIFLPANLRKRLEDLLATAGAGLKPEVVYTSFVNMKNEGSGFAVRTKLQVVNVDDSTVILKILKKGLEDAGFEVLDQISDPTLAVNRILNLRPDVVTMDIQMPTLTGVEVVKRLKQVDSPPVLMISSLSPEDGPMVFEALQNGAFDYLQKPKDNERTQFFEDLNEMCLAAASGHEPARQALKARPVARPANVQFGGNLLWCIGSSTGGTQALTSIFTALPAHVPPTLVVQHIPPVYSRAFAESVNKLVPFTVKEAENGDVLKPDHVYIAAGGLQLGIRQRGQDLVLELRDTEPVNRFKPSVDHLFFEVAKLKGLRIVAGILTGMGKDGAQGLMALKEVGARTFAQDEASSAVFGMPRTALEIGAAEQALPLEKIASHLLELSLGRSKDKAS